MHYRPKHEKQNKMHSKKTKCFHSIGLRKSRLLAGIKKKKRNTTHLTLKEKPNKHA